MPAPKTDDKPDESAAQVVEQHAQLIDSAVAADQADEPELRPEQLGYCHNSECPQYRVEVNLWHSVQNVPVICGCGHLLEPLPVNYEAEMAPVDQEPVEA